MNRLAILLLFLNQLPNTLLASNEIPSWVTTPPLADVQYFYGVGTGESTSLVEAKLQAEQIALEQISAIAFGVTMSSKSELKIDLDGSKLNSSVATELSAIHMKSVETIANFQESLENNIQRYFVLRRYSKLEASKVKFIISRPSTTVKSCKTSVNTPGIKGQIFLNGKFIDATPLIFYVPYGNHELKVASKGYLTKTFHIVCISGETLDFGISLKKTVGAISIVSIPTEANVEIQGSPQLTSPIEKHELAPGIYTLRISKDGYMPWEKSIEINEGKKTNIEITLLPTASIPKLVSENNDNAALIRLLNQQAQMAIEKENWLELFELQKQLISLAPKDADYYYQASRALRNLSRYKESIPYSLLGFKLKPTDIGYSQLCHSYYWIHETKRALSYCTEYVAQYPNSPDANRLMGYLSIQLGNIRSTVKYYKKVQQLNPASRDMEKYCLENSENRLIQSYCD